MTIDLDPLRAYHEWLAAHGVVPDALLWRDSPQYLRWRVDDIVCEAVIDGKSGHMVRVWRPAPAAICIPTWGERVALFTVTADHTSYLCWGLRLTPHPYKEDHLTAVIRVARGASASPSPDTDVNGQVREQTWIDLYQTVPPQMRYRV